MIHRDLQNQGLSMKHKSVSVQVSQRFLGKGQGKIVKVVAEVSEAPEPSPNEAVDEDDTMPTPRLFGDEG